MPRSWSRWLPRQRCNAFRLVGDRKTLHLARLGQPSALSAGATGSISGDGAAEEVDLVLLAHDHVLEQVL
jgi:hypothetical protein